MTKNSAFGASEERKEKNEERREEEALLAQSSDNDLIRPCGAPSPKGATSSGAYAPPSPKGEGSEMRNADMVLVTPEALSGIINELMAPIMRTIGKMLENNTEAIEKLSIAQQIQNDRLEALEKQIRLQTPVTAKQASYINEAVKTRARELLDKKGISEDKAVKKLSARIRKAVLIRYGIGGVREIPKYEYNVALGQIGMWNDMIAIRDIVKEVRDAEQAERAENMDV